MINKPMTEPARRWWTLSPKVPCKRPGVGGLAEGRQSRPSCNTMVGLTEKVTSEQSPDRSGGVSLADTWGGAFLDQRNS